MGEETEGRINYDLAFNRGAHKKVADYLKKAKVVFPSTTARNVLLVICYYLRENNLEVVKKK